MVLIKKSIILCDVIRYSLVDVYWRFWKSVLPPPSKSKVWKETTNSMQNTLPRNIGNFFETAQIEQDWTKLIEWEEASKKNLFVQVVWQ
jgi:hypothetical protein